MAEFVQQRLEEMVSELNQLQNAGLFDTTEIREIIRKRKALEYKLRRKMKEKQDYLLYIKYEMNVLALIKKRRKANKYVANVKEIEVPIVKRIHKLFELACTRFKDDIKLWLSHIEFCKQKHEKKRASRLFTNLLKIHPHSADVWILAAKHELEQRQSMQHARGLLQQAIAVNPESQQLWLQYFHMELLNAESLRQKVADLAGGESQLEESNVLVLSGAAATVVFTNACLQFPDNVDLRISFIDTARLFNFTESLQDAIYDDLEAHFTLSEVARCAIAKRPLHKALVLYPQFDSNIDEIKKLEQEMYRLFDKSVMQLPTEAMWNLYLETCLDILQQPLSKHHSRQNVQQTLSAFARAADCQLLSEPMAVSWLSVLVKTGQIDEALNASQKLVLHFTGSIQLWTERVSIVVRTASAQSDIVLKCVNAAVDACISSRDMAAVELWRLAMNWCLLNCPQRVVSLCERGLLAQSTAVRLYIKLFYLDFMVTHEDARTVRNLYCRLFVLQPSSVELLERYVTFELSQAKPRMKYVRRAYEEALLAFGSKHIDVWLNYMKVELTDVNGKPENVSNLHWRAEKNLQTSLVEEFKQRFAQLTSDTTCRSD